jgi:hypothetical protein
MQEHIPDHILRRFTVRYFLNAEPDQQEPVKFACGVLSLYVSHVCDRGRSLTLGDFQLEAR